MKILFDHCVDRRLRKHFAPHEVRTAKEERLAHLSNGALLQAAQQEFAALVTTDKSINYQQNRPDYDIALIVLRGITNRATELVALMPAVLSTLETIQPGEVVYLYTAAAQQIAARRQQRQNP